MTPTEARSNRDRGGAHGNDPGWDLKGWQHSGDDEAECNDPHRFLGVVRPVTERHRPRGDQLAVLEQCVDPG